MSEIMDLKKKIVQIEYNIDDINEILKNRDDKYFEVMKNNYEPGYYCEICGFSYTRIDQHLKSKIHEKSKICYINDLERTLKNKKEELLKCKEIINVHFLKTYGYELYKD